MGRVINAGKLGLVFAALAMLVLSGPLRHAAHLDGGHGAAAVVLSEAMQHGHVPAHIPAHDLAKALLILLHGHGGGHADHDHSTPFLAAPAGADVAVSSSEERAAAAAYTGREPRAPEPPPRA